MSKTYVISAEAAGQRLDQAIMQLTEAEISRSYVQQLIRATDITVNETEAKPSYRVEENDVVSISIPVPKKMILEAQNIPLDVVFEDAHLLVLNKQAGLTVHPGAGQADNTLVNALLYHCGPSLLGIGGVERPGIIHRLDKDTTGLMIVAKTQEAHYKLSTQLQERSIGRRYLAICWGAPPMLAGTVEAALDRHPKDHRKRAVTLRGGKHATTHYRVLESFGKRTASLIECRLDTGRTHQIRVHLAHKRCPLIGDTLYGGGRQHPQIPPFSRQALHAYQLEFTHPNTGKRLSFTQDFRQNEKKNAGSDLCPLYEALKTLEK